MKIAVFKITNFHFYIKNAIRSCQNHSHLKQAKVIPKHNNIVFYSFFKLTSQMPWIASRNWCCPSFSIFTGNSWGARVKDIRKKIKCFQTFWKLVSFRDIWEASFLVTYELACSAGVFIGRTNVLLTKVPCWNSKREEKMGRVTPTLRVTIFTLPNLPPS